jgi:hypothetical protein
MDESPIGLTEQDGATPFEYPHEEYSKEIEAEIQKRALELALERVNGFLHKIAIIAFTSHNARKEFACLFYLCGLDISEMIGAEQNTIKHIGKRFRISKAGMRKVMTRVAKDFGIDWLTANRGHRLQRQWRGKPVKGGNRAAPE